MKKRLFFFVLLVVISGIENSVYSQSNLISTFAGSMSAGWSGDGGAATIAELNAPSAIVVDTAGNVFIADRGNNRVRMVNTLGVIVEIAGNGIAGWAGDGGPATAAELNIPAGLAIDANGDLFVSEWGNHTVRKISPAINGVISTIAGIHNVYGFSGDEGAATAAKFFHPYGLSFDSYGNLYIADQYNCVIRKIITHSGYITASDTIKSIAGIGATEGYNGDNIPATSALLWEPNFVYLDRYNNVYISDNGNQRIRKIGLNDTIVTVAGNGTAGWIGDGTPAISAEIDFPAGMVLDDLGNLYFTCYNNRVRKVNSSGIISTIAGTGVAGFYGDGGPATAAELTEPNDVKLDRFGNILIDDDLNSRIRIINAINNSPEFIGGNVQSLSLCSSETATPIDSLLSVMDSDAGQSVNWSLLVPPLHGTAIVSYTTTSTGSALIPAGLTYSPEVGYSGTDRFVVSASNGISTVTTINVTINANSNSGIISGIDSVCPGDSVSLSESVSGGIWSNSNILISYMNAGGVATGLYPGVDTVIYTVVGDCGIASSIFPFVVKSYDECGTAVPSVQSTFHEGVEIYPDPNAGEFTIDIQSFSDEKSNIRIYDLNWEKVREFEVVNNQPLRVNFDAPPGIYCVQVITGGRNYITKMAITQ